MLILSTPTPLPPLLPYLQGVEEHSPRSNRHPEPLHGIPERLHHVRGGLEYVWPHVVHEVEESVLTAETKHAQSHVLHCPAGSLPVHQVPAGNTATVNSKWKYQVEIRNNNE